MFHDPLGLIEKMSVQLGQAVTNVLELQLQLEKAMAQREELFALSASQAERIENDSNLIKVVREERDRFRALAEKSNAKDTSTPGTGRRARMRAEQNRPSDAGEGNHN